MRFLTTVIFILILTVLLLIIFSTKPHQKAVIAPTAEAPTVEIPAVTNTTPETQPESSAPAAPAPSPVPVPVVPPPPPPGSPPVSSMPKLLIPVMGIRPEQLHDTYTEARSEGRIHNAIDIMAAHGTAVLAATDGTIQRLFYSERGGNTLYQLSPDGKWVFYYAHLDSYAAGISAGKQVKQGEVIAYVGDTGNAGPGNYHLHFAIWAVTDPKRFWDGESINPYPLLHP